MTRREEEPWTRRLAVAALVDLFVFAYLVWFRTSGLAENFWLYADQERDWRIALRSFDDLPLVGPPSLAGGHTAGPVYYWYLWLVQTALGPWFDRLPHTGGIGIALLQSAADVVLVHAFSARLQSRTLAVALVLLFATATPDVAVTSTIWNPPVAAAFSKLALGVALLTRQDSRWSLLTVSLLSWLAVQAHTTALPVTVVLLACGVAGAGYTRAALPGRLGLVTAAIIVLQIPWLIHQATAPRSTAALPMVDSVSAVLANPAQLRLGESAVALLRALGANTGLALSPWAVAGGLVIGLVLAVRYLRDGQLAIIAVGPLLTAVAIYAVWQGGLNENYWYLTLAPFATLTFAMWLTGTSVRIRRAIAVVLLVGAALLQPLQARAAATTLRDPSYGPRVRGSRATVVASVPIGAITAAFPVPPNTRPEFLFEILGGRLDAAASAVAIIDARGNVTYR